MVKVQGLKSSDPILTASWNCSSCGSTTALVNNQLVGLQSVGIRNLLSLFELLLESPRGKWLIKYNTFTIIFAPLYTSHAPLHRPNSLYSSRPHWRHASRNYREQTRMSRQIADSVTRSASCEWSPKNGRNLAGKLRAAF